jgi:hypothetical protein
MRAYNILFQMPTKISDQYETCLFRVKATSSAFVYLYVFIFFVTFVIGHKKLYIYIFTQIFLQRSLAYIFWIFGMIRQMEGGPETSLLSYTLTYM